MARPEEAAAASTTMAKPRPTPVAADAAPLGRCGRSLRLARAAMEAVVLLMVCLSPWAFGAVDPFWEFLLLVGVGVVLVLWAVVLLLEGQLSWRKCPVTLCLAALCLLGFAQLTPLPRPILAAASPATARMYGELLPAAPEALPGKRRGASRLLRPARPSVLSGRDATGTGPSAGGLSSVRGGAQQPRHARRLPPPRRRGDGERRRAFPVRAAPVLRAPHQTIYWTFPAGVEVFGPFICRNHFPFYVNVCLGLAAGLLLSLGAPATGGAPRGGGLARSLSAALHDPRRLWVGVALVLMLAAVAFSLSRGGFVAPGRAALFFLVLRFQRSPRFSQLAGAVLLGGAALALLAWFGADRVKTRLATVLDGQAAHEDRVPLWSRLLPSAAAFPVFGSGYGTFDYVEPLTRTGGEDAGYRYATLTTITWRPCWRAAWSGWG